MKRFFKSVSIVLLCMAMFAPGAEGRGRNNGNERTTTQKTQNHSSRPGNMGRPTHGSTRPGNNGGNVNNRPSGNNRPGNGVRPGNNGGNVNNRPSGNNRPDHGVRPGHNGGNVNNRPSGNNRPDHGVRPGHNGGNVNNRPSGNNRPDHGVRPGQNNFGPGHAHRPDNRPGYRPGAHRPSHVGHRPTHIPHFAGWHRPAPPRHWRPAPNWRPFRSILGITLGTGFNISLNFLNNNGYNVNYYGDNTIYLRDVSMLNMLWPDAVLYYNNGGGLCGSRFVYSSGYYDMNRYNMAYASLSNTYGMPASIQNTSSGVEVTWWGVNNQFVRLSYESNYAQNGSLNYYTTLSFGV